MLPPEWTRQRLHKFDASRHGTHTYGRFAHQRHARPVTERLPLLLARRYHGRAANRAPTTRAVAAKVLRGVRRGGQSTEAVCSKTGEQGGGGGGARAGWRRRRRQA